MKQLMDDLMRGPVVYLDEGLGAFYWPQQYKKDVWFTALYTADQMREAIKQAVEAEQAIHQERLKFTAERWEIECQSQVEIEREALAQRQPLTDEEMRDIARGFKANSQDRLRRAWDDVTEFARAIEAAHGIKEKT